MYRVEYYNYENGGYVHTFFKTLDNAIRKAREIHKQLNVEVYIYHDTEIVDY